MQNHYTVLGINSSASADEIRRAYRILARRYHPDLNPGHTNSERFRKIAEAYEVLSDSKKKAAYDANLESKQRDDVARGFAAYERAQEQRSRVRRQRHGQQTRRENGTEQAEPQSNVVETSQRTIRKVSDKMRNLLRSTMGIGEGGRRTQPSERDIGSRGVQGTIERVSVIEVSVSIRDAILGTKKAIEIPEPEGQRKVSVKIPAGVRNGSVIRLRAKNLPGEDLVLIVRVASHPLLSIQARGLVAEIPITIQEAIVGAHISVPTLEEPISVKIPPGSQSGSEIRLKNRGVILRDGTRGDLFIRLMVKVPDAPAEAVGLKEKVSELEKYYSVPVRQGLPKNLSE